MPVLTVTRRDGESFDVQYSPEDQALLDGHKWTVVAIGRNLYTMTHVDGRTTYLHRLILGLTYGDKRQVDHINRNGLDNQRSNLRIATNALNRQNFSSSGYSNNTSGHRGVTWCKERQRWLAVCTIAGHSYRIGRFKSKEDAHQAVVAFRRENMPYAVETD